MQHMQKTCMTSFTCSISRIIYYVHYVCRIQDVQNTDKGKKDVYLKKKYWEKVMRYFLDSV